MAQALTKIQHYVPKAYLRSWRIPSTDRVHLYDLENQTTQERNIDRILYEDWFYEEDPHNPDNRVENTMAQGTENRFGALRYKFDQLSNAPSFKKRNFKDIKRSLGEILDSDAQKVLKEFSAHQYLRVPDAVKQKEEEMGVVGLDGSVRTPDLNAGVFVDSGYQYLAKTFEECSLMVCLSFADKFITTDRPVIDFNKANRPVCLAEDFVNDDETIALMPLNTRILVYFLPKVFLQKQTKKIPMVSFHQISPSDARKANTLLIQGAKRFVVAQDSSPWIFNVAKKRKRGIGDALK